jgi:catechol 2,3-dioxygenase-like lactoylglutathione lyase family enzyme
MALADDVFQIAYVVPDIHDAIRFFKEKLGVPTFMLKEDIRVQEQTYRGEPGEYRQSIAFGFLGQMQIELIQPLSGTSTYSEFLETNPKGGVQHLGILVDDYNAGVTAMEGQGFTLVQSGRNGETRFGYFDVNHPIGTLMEVVYLAPQERAGYERMKRSEA